MYFLGQFVAFAAIHGVGASVLRVPQQLAARQNGSSSNACEVVSASAASAIATAANARATVDAQLAFDCLNSVSLRTTEAKALVEAVMPYVEWQSDLAYLKDPPADYPFPAVDIMGSLKAVQNNITAGKYKNEYEFQVALFNSFAQAHDGHFDFYPDALTRAFIFRRQVALVSVSKDGVELPKIYVLNDTMDSLAAGSTFKPSAVTKINGVEASRFVQDTSDPVTPFQDKDAAYNAFFMSKASVASGLNGFFEAGGPFSFVYPGPTTTLTFENGTTKEYRNLASLRASFAGVTDGDTFYKKFCSGPPTTTLAPLPTGTPGTNRTSTSRVISSTTSTPAPVATALGYPQPVVIASDGSISGYYLSDPGNTDVAVLSVLTFSPDKPDEFQAVSQKFTAAAKAAGKKKLVIDVSLNGGGFLFLGYDMFRQFFPQVAQDGFTRFRENPAFLKIGKIISDSIPGNFTKEHSSDELIQSYESFYNYKYDLNMVNNTFDSWNAKYGNVIRDKGDQFSSLVRWDMSDPLSTYNTTYGLGMNITGYGNLTKTVQPFAAEDIVIMYDGFCASTCTIFSEFMRLQGNVKSVAFGGRPSTTKIQGIGGVKGSQSYSWASIHSDAQRALQIQRNNSQPTAAELLVISDLPMNRSSASGVNLRDNILPQNMGDGIPAQFVQELSDCRLFWTPAMIGDVRAVWNAAAKAAWGGGPCVAGEISRKTAIASEAIVGGVGPSRTGVINTEVVKSDTVLNKDSEWEQRHGVKVTYNYAVSDVIDSGFEGFDSYLS